MTDLTNRIALVAGATRGAGRGIACMLGERGATVYCTGRSTREHPATDGRPETLEETAAMVARHGGRGIAVRVDHTDAGQVAALMQHLAAEHGRLDILVNDVWGGDALAEWGKPFWEQSFDKGVRMFHTAVFGHVLTSQAAVPLMLRQKSGLIVEITDGDSPDYRGNFFYDLTKAANIRTALAMAAELRPHGITVAAVTPGFLRSEAMLDLFGVTEANWQEGAKKDPHFIASETPYFVGRAVAALAADRRHFAKTGGVYASWTLADEYGFTDIDGRKPHWGRYFKSLPTP